MSQTSSPALTTVRDTVYKSDGSLATGSVVITWDSFISQDSKPIFGGSKTITLNNGSLVVGLIPNLGASPAGTSYSVRYYQSGTLHAEEFWVVPTSSPTAPPNQPSVVALGSTGSSTYCYWISAILPQGETTLSPAGCISNGPNSMSTNNFARITWVAVSGATSYRIFRTSTTTVPGGTGNLLVTLTSLLTYDDHSNSLQATTVPEFNTTDTRSLQQVRVVVPPSEGLMISPSQVTGSAIVASPTVTQTISAPPTSGIPLQVRGHVSNGGNLFELFTTQGATTPTTWISPAGGLVSSIAPTLNTFQPGSLLLGGSGGQLTQDNSQLHWDSTESSFRVGPRTGFSPLLQPSFSVFQHSITSMAALTGTSASLGVLSQSNDSTAYNFGSYSIAESKHSSGARSASIGLEADGYHTGAGTINNLTGIYGYAENNAPAGGNANTVNSIGANAWQSGASTTTEMSGLRLYPNGRSAGTVVNNYGLKIDDQTTGNANWAIKTGLGKVEFGGPVFAARLNNVRFADQFPGADICAKIAAAIADLPSTGGAVDARGAEGSQVCASDPLVSNNRKVTLLLGSAVITASTSWGSTSSGVVQLVGLGNHNSSATIVSFGATAGIVPGSDGWEISDLTIDGNGSSSTDGLVLGGPGARSLFIGRNLTIQQFQHGLSITAASTDNVFYDSRFMESYGSTGYGIYIAGTTGSSNFPTIVSFIGGRAQNNSTAGAKVGLARGVLFDHFLFEDNSGDGLLLGSAPSENSENIVVRSSWFENNGNLPIGTNFDLKAVRVSALAIHDSTFSSSATTPIRVLRNDNLSANQAERVIISGGIYTSANPAILDTNVQGVQMLNTGLHESGRLTDNAVDTYVVERNQLVKAGASMFRTTATTAGLGIVSLDTGNTASAQGLTFLKSAAGFNPMAAVRAAATNYGTDSRSDLVFHANTGSESSPSEHGRFVGATGLLSLTSGAVSPQFTSSATDSADAGVLRLGNSEAISAESSPAGPDGTLKYNSSEQWESNSPIALDGSTADASKAVITTSDPTGTRTFTLPDANSNPVQPITCSGTDKVSAVSSAGVITCSADQTGGGGGGGDNLRAEDGDNAGTFTAMADADFDDSGDVDFQRVTGPPDAIIGVIRPNSVGLSADTTGNYVGSISDGVGIDGSASGEGAGYTPQLDLTEINSHTYGDNSLATISQAFDPSGATNPAWSYSNGVANLSAGTLQQNGSPVVTQSLTLAAGSGLAGGGDLSANRSFDVSVTGPIEITSDSVACSTCTTANNSQTLTNKTFDSEGTGNVLLLPQKVEFQAAGCDGSSPASAFDLPASAAPAKSCLGSSPHRSGALDFADGASALTATTRYLLPSDWTASGGVDIRYIWSSASTSTNSVVWTVQTACVADGEDIVNPGYNSTQTVADANNATANTRNSVGSTGITMTGCAAGESLFLRVGRDPTNASDTLAATSLLHSIEITIRRQI